MTGWSTEQIIALAPDPGSAKTGKELASPRKWLSLGYNEQAAWGECQGSAKEPYQTQIDLRGPAFKCSCPSRKFPCKHALGLFLLLAGQTGVFTRGAPPGWVQEWLDKRDQQAEKPSNTKEKSKRSADAGSQAQRRAKREERVRQGLDDLDLWLSDLVREGLSSTQAKPPSFWDAPAARLIDAQAPGLARRVRGMAAIPGSGEGWERRLLSEAGSLFLAIEGYKRLEQLPPETQADLRTLIGWNQDQDEIASQDGVRDNWIVSGKRIEEQPLGALGRSSTLKVQRTWLWGKTTRRPAMILSFAAPGQSLDAGLVPGTSLEAELAYFSGAYPLRALVKKQTSTPTSWNTLPGMPNMIEAMHAYSAALAANPWLEIFPIALSGIIPFQLDGAWGIRDLDGNYLPLATAYPLAWTILALSGCRPIDLFGEWNGDFLWPLSVCAGGRFVFLQQVNRS